MSHSISSLEMITPVLLAPVAAMVALAGNRLRRISERVGQRAEYLADDLAVDVAGSESVKDLMIKELVADACLRALQSASQQGVSDLWAAEAQFVASVPVSEIERRRRVAGSRLQRADVSHPPTELRIRLIESRPNRLTRVPTLAQRFTAIDHELKPWADQVQSSIRQRHPPTVRKIAEQQGRRATHCELRHRGCSLPDHLRRGAARQDDVRVPGDVDVWKAGVRVVRRGSGLRPPCGDSHDDRSRLIPLAAPPRRRCSCGIPVPRRLGAGIKRGIQGTLEGPLIEREVVSGRRVVTTAFIVIFLAEWGDLTQILTANLAAHYHSPLSVGLGAVSALWSVKSHHTESFWSKMTTDTRSALLICVRTNFNAASRARSRSCVSSEVKSK